MLALRGRVELEIPRLRACPLTRGACSAFTLDLAVIMPRPPRELVDRERRAGRDFQRSPCILQPLQERHCAPGRVPQCSARAREPREKFANDIDVIVVVNRSGSSDGAHQGGVLFDVAQVMVEGFANLGL